ncbi:hypothetical protein BLNAU_6335 [Blattamonas nauphoetae]|uniref:Uncharacterized protein n=1 Tax=Blattamonas nauphoetae TaxID=2049346 RepID=A0ABQ9Y499_9EUKA|nr:hypothetical protein BLNAU_6335 [Blattamonas nauphoetae]
MGPFRVCFSSLMESSGGPNNVSTFLLCLRLSFGNSTSSPGRYAESSPFGKQRSVARSFHENLASLRRLTRRFCLAFRSALNRRASDLMRSTLLGLNRFPPTYSNRRRSSVLTISLLRRPHDNTSDWSDWESISSRLRNAFRVLERSVKLFDSIDFFTLVMSTSFSGSLVVTHFSRIASSSGLSSNPVIDVLTVSSNLGFTEHNNEAISLRMLEVSLGFLLTNDRRVHLSLSRIFSADRIATSRTRSSSLTSSRLRSSSLTSSRLRSSSLPSSDTATNWSRKASDDKSSFCFSSRQDSALFHPSM